MIITFYARGVAYSNYFWKSGPICKAFLPQKRLILQYFFKIFANFEKSGPLSKDFLTKWDPWLRIPAEKTTHLGGTSPYASTCEYPPGFYGYFFISHHNSYIKLVIWSNGIGIEGWYAATRSLGCEIWFHAFLHLNGSHWWGMGPFHLIAPKAMQVWVLN